MHKMRGGASAPPLLFVESAFTGRDLARQLSRRCLIPADGFYEWQTPAEPKARKQPWYVSPSDAPLCALAGRFTLGDLALDVVGRRCGQEILTG